MATCLGCLRRCLSPSPGHVPLKEQPVVILDTNYMGNDVVIVKNGRRICGGGAALANVPIVQSKAYFEIKLQQSGQWGVGLATRKADLNRVPLGMDAESWVMCSDGVLRHGGEDKGKISELPQEGDVIGVSYDHVELNFYLNGRNLQNPITESRGTLYPVVYVEDGATIDVLFSDFYHTPPSGYERILLEQSLF